MFRLMLKFKDKNQTKTHMQKHTTHGSLFQLPCLTLLFFVQNSVLSFPVGSWCQERLRDGFKVRDAWPVTAQLLGYDGIRVGRSDMYSHQGLKEISRWGWENLQRLDLASNRTVFLGGSKWKHSKIPNLGNTQQKIPNPRYICWWWFFGFTVWWDMWSFPARSILIGMNEASIVHTVLQTRCLRGAAKTRMIIDSITNHNSFLTAFFDICWTKFHTKDVYTHLYIYIHNVCFFIYLTIIHTCVSICVPSIL